MHVIPIFKNDNRRLKINCSPVSLLTCFSKICEEDEIRRSSQLRTLLKLVVVSRT